MSRRPSSRAWLSFWALLLACLAALPARAEELLADRAEFAVGETVTLTIPGSLGLLKPKWRANPAGVIQFSDRGRKEAKAKGMAPGRVQVSATVDWKLGSTTYEVSLCVKSGTDPSACGQDGTGKDVPDWGNSGPALQRLSFDQRRMADLLRTANQALTRGEAPDAVSRQFYADLARLNLTEPLVKLNALKTELSKAGLADAALGERFQSAAGTPVERALLVYRRDLTMESIRAAVAEVSRSHGTDAGSIFLAKIGKWAIQNPDMFTLAGDIDFSFVGARAEIILALRDAYKRQITERSGGLDMVAIDSVATAHGFAEHMVYMGIQGRKFADDAMMSMNEGVERIDFRNPDAIGTPEARQVSGKQALIETVLEETGRRYRENGYEEKGRSLANEIERTWNDRRNQSVEPMLSMEMARHLEHDIIRNVDVFAAIDIIKKGSKYLRRSNDQTTGDLKIDPADAAWAKFVVDVDEMAKTAKAEDLVRFIDSETRKLGIAGFEMKLVDGKATLVAAPGAAESFLAKAKQMIWSNVSNGMDIRIRALTDAFNNRGQSAGPGTPDDLRPERMADTLRMLASGLEVMKQSHSVIPREIMTKTSVLAKLIESYGGKRGYPLPAEEIEKLKQLLRESVHNDTTLLLKMGAVISHIDQWMVKNYDSLSAKLPASRQLSMVDAKIDTLNSLLDAMDNSLLGALREKGVLELDMGKGADGKPRLHTTTFPRIAAINQRLNQSVLGRIGNNTAFKTFNLAQEGDAYYSAIMQAGTPSEAFSNVATEIFRRRVPGGGMVEALVMENYTRAGIEVVYTIFPPLAVPEGLYGMGASFYEARRQEWWQAELETMIDKLYETTEFAKDSASPGHYPLTHVTYKQVRYSRKGLEEGRSFILDPDVDKTLTENLRAGDPFLTLMAELENHGAAGDKIRANFRAKADQRWIEVKRDFVRHMIDKLEKRHDAEVADLTGQIPAIYEELMATADKLEIRDRVTRRMDAEWDSNNLKAFWTWLKNVGRQGAWGSTLAETERNKAAAIVIRYRDAYRNVLAARDRLEGEIARTLENSGVAAQDLTQHKQRLLTGIVFLTGEYETDKQTASQWAGQAARTEKAVRDELAAIKGLYLQGASLDTPFDNSTLGQVFFEDVWIEALRSMKIPVISAASFKRAAEDRKDRRAALIKGFEIHYANQTGTATVRVLRQDTRLGVERAKVMVKADQAELRPADRGNGVYTLTGLPPGNYTVSASADGYKAADGKPVATATLAMQPRSDTSRMGEVTLLMLPGKTDALSVSIEATPANRRIRSSGENSQAVLKAQLVGLPDSGTPRFQWTVGDRVLAQGEGRDSATFSGGGHGGKTVTVTVLAIDAKNRQVQASIDIEVGAAEDIEVKLAPHRSEIGRNQDETIEVLSPSEHGVKYRWTLSDGGRPRDFDGDRRWLINGAYNVGKTVYVSVRAATPDGRTGSASTSVTVLDQDKDVKEKDKPTGSDSNLATLIDAALKARDWKRLVDRLDAEKKSDLKMKNVVAWQANIDALGAALKTLKDERMDWALAWRPYIDALDHIDSITWDKLMRQVETKRNEVENRCWEKSGSSEPHDKRVARCQTEGRKFEENCVGTWPAQHWEEVKRIRIAKQELGDAVHLLHSAGYGGFRNWFEAVEKLADKHKLPFPYPKPVTPRLKYALSCATVEPPAGQKPEADVAQLKVVVPAPTASVAFGKSVTLNASASGGKPPYRFEWSSGGSGARVAVTPRWAGDWTVTVNATDAEGKTGKGSATLRVTPARVKLKGLKPTVFYGSRAPLSLPGSEPAPAVDPCVGRKPGNNPFDECAKVEIDPCATPGNPFCVDTSRSGTVDYSGRRGDKTGNRATADGDQQQYIVNPAQEFARPPRETGKQVIWQAEPALTFAPPTSLDGNTRVTYDRMGEVKLWCEIQEQIEGAFHTVGECDQETIKVIAPKFSVSFTPPEGQGRIGQDIRLRIASEPSVPDDLVDFRWFDPATSNRLELTPNAREIGFKVKDAKPVVFKALARVPHHGDSIAEIAATYTGLQFQVKAWAEEPGTRPMMWDPVKGGLKPVPRGQYATHERIPLRAELQGGEAPSGLRWNWTVNDGSTISNPISQTPTVLRTSPGGIEATVEARDAGGAVLGSGSISLSVIEVRDTSPPPASPTVSLSADPASVERGARVTLSASASGGKPPYSYSWQGAAGKGNRANLTANKTGSLNAGVTVTDSKGNKGTASITVEVTENQADRDRKEVLRLSEQARDQLGRGDLAGAVSLAQEARKLDAKAAGPVASEVSAAAKKVGWQGVYDRDFSQVVQNLEAAHALNPADKDAKDKLERARRFAQVWPQVEAKAREFDAQMAEQKYFSAHKSLLAMQELQKEMPGISDKSLPRRVMRDFDQGMAEYSAYMAQVEDIHRRAFKEEDWHTMRENAEQALLREHSTANEKMLRSNLEHARKMLSERAALTAKHGKSMAGTWTVNANSYGGKVEIAEQGGRLSGRLWLDAHGKWEELLEVRFDGGKLVFTRPIPGYTQRYTGTRTGNRIDGTFTQQGSSTVYKWHATLLEEARNDVIPVTRFDPIKLIDAVPQANSSTFKRNLRSDLAVNTRSNDRTPYFMTMPRESLLDLVRIERACLAGDASGNTRISIDNFILFEVFEANGAFIKAGTVGSHEGLTRNGQPVQELASGYHHNACAVDLRNFLPSGRPFRLKASAMDYGGIGYSSEVWLLLAGQGSVPPVGGGRDYTGYDSPQTSQPAPGKGELIFEVGNIGGVGNGPSKATKFTLAAPHVVTLIRNYHWNSARGAAPGSIALKNKDGSYGPWQATGSPGQGGVPNAYWTVYPNLTLPAGTYTVIDSDPATWSHNAESNNRGFVRVEGYPADAGQPSASPSTGNVQVDSAIKELDGLLDAVKSLKGLFGK